MAEKISKALREELEPLGFECHHFKIGWYNEHVQQPYVLDFPGDTLAFTVISTPHMFDKAFQPYVIQQQCVPGNNAPHDPIDQCMAHQFDRVKQAFPEHQVDAIQDFEMHPGTRRPRVLVQTAGHVAGAAHYYQPADVTNKPWPATKRLYGVSVHPKYGGWFAFRGILIFKDIQVPELEQREPPDPIPDEAGRIELLERFNGNWKDWSYRDVIPVSERYSDTQMEYFATEPKHRWTIIEKMKQAAAH